MLARLVSVMPVCANHHSHPAWQAAILWKFHGTQAEAMLSEMLRQWRRIRRSLIRIGLRSLRHTCPCITASAAYVQRGALCIAPSVSRSRAPLSLGGCEMGTVYLCT